MQILKMQLIIQINNLLLSNTAAKSIKKVFFTPQKRFTVLSEYSASSKPLTTFITGSPFFASCERGEIVPQRRTLMLTQKRKEEKEIHFLGFLGYCAIK